MTKRLKTIITIMINFGNLLFLIKDRDRFSSPIADTSDKRRIRGIKINKLGAGLKKEAAIPKVIMAAVSQYFLFPFSTDKK